jgi:SM-20-related protein
MVALQRLPGKGGGNIIDETLFGLIADDIERQGYSVRPGAFPQGLAEALLAQQQGLAASNYEHAGIGRGQRYLKNEFVRTDEICWITGESEAGQRWLEWAAQLQNFLNRRLFLGLFSFESHFAHYAPGDYYRRHHDAFRGQTNRVLSLVLYLNSGWTPADGGELVLYRDDRDREGLKVVPLFGTIVTFLSEDFAHEVLPARRDRYSIAGWFRVNMSIGGRVDPPR